MLGGPDGDYDAAQSSLVPVMQSAVRASAGPGAIPDGESARPYFAFDERWLRRLTSAPARQLSVIRVEGDSMAPTLADGDDILIDRNDRDDRLRDGVYVLRVDEALVVKRLALAPDRAAGDGPVGQSGLFGLARLRFEGRALHRPGDLGGTEGRLAATRGRSARRQMARAFRLRDR